MSCALTEQSEGLVVTTRYSEDVECIFVDYSEAAENSCYIREIYDEVRFSKNLPAEIKKQVMDELEEIASGGIHEFDLVMDSEYHNRNRKPE